MTMFLTPALLMLAIFCSIQYGMACSCMKMHPQEKYCNDDFVILARVKKFRHLNKSDYGFYKVVVRKEFKMSEKGSVALKSGVLHTAIDESVCGVTLKPGATYVLSGRIVNLKARINLCGMAMEWKTTTRRQRKGLRMLYEQGCNCTISKNKISKDGCQYKNSCDDLYGICSRQRNGSCHWIRNPVLAKCRLETRNATLAHIRKNQIF
ncbi:tissue inhibitor of metalloproteases isoform X2 [Rhynchophorus ferrugineus]